MGDVVVVVGVGAPIASLEDGHLVKSLAVLNVKIGFVVDAAAVGAIVAVAH